MHRNKLLKLLDDYQDRFPTESETIARLVAFVRANNDCFQRELAIGHITGSAWLLDADRQRVLLTHHRKLNRWLQPGGHADGQGDIARVALRESIEESGLAEVIPIGSGLFDVDIHLIPERGSEAAHFHYDCRFLFCSGDDATYVVSEESNDLAWVPLADVRQYNREESIHRIVIKTNSIPR